MAVVCTSYLILLACALACFCTQPSRATTFTNGPLPSYPLAVKNPYLSTWVPGNQLSNAATAQPQFWVGTNLTWPILARVDGKLYALFGNSPNISNAEYAETESISFTSSHTYIALSADEMTFELDFFSPVLPGTSDYARQSLPYSYLTVTAKPSYGRFADVQILSAIDYTWTAQDGASGLNYTTAGNSGFFWFYNPDAYLFSENDQMASYGSVLYGTTVGVGSTAACGSASEISSTFAATGRLNPGGYSGCSGDDLAALARDLGPVGPGGAGVTFTVGLDRVDAIQYLNTSTQTGAYRAYWPTVPDAVEYVLNENLPYALIQASVLDAEIAQRAKSVSSSYGDQYATIVEASVRQAFGAIELTVPLNDTTASPWVFLKEISSDGNVNTVDVIFQSWPIFVSLNPNYIRMLFEPVLAYLQSGGWPNPWVVHDLGTNYPNATGHNDGIAEEMPLFETSTLFILLVAYEKYTGDKSFAQEYASLLTGYAEYLVPNTLYPASQLISVDALAPTPNQTALAIQSTIGLNAAAKITGNETYSSIAASYAHKIYDEGLGLNNGTPSTSTHFTYNYGNDTTWNVVFAAYSDVILDLQTFPAAAWEMQSQWYEEVIQPGGLPWAGPITDLNYSTPINWGLTDWNIETAAISSPAVQEAVVNTTYTFLTNGLNTIPFGTKYVVEGDDIGTWLADEARSTVGTHFAIMALEQGYWYDE